MRRLVPMVVVAALAAALPSGAEAARTRTVVLEDVKFKPGTVRIKRGDRVRWTWQDDATSHNVRSRGARRFRSSATKTDGEHRVRFRRRGTYRYVCSLHPGMDGKVVVR